MNLRSMGCCAVQEITNIRSDGGPVNTMAAFCRANMPEKKRMSYKGTQIPAEETLYSFYIFTAAVNTPGKEGAYRSMYGRDFANFIRDNGLGEIVESPVRVNVAFHEDHSNQIFIWAINQKGIQKWWEAYQKVEEDKVKALKAVEAIPPPPPVIPPLEAEVKAKRVYKKKDLYGLYDNSNFAAPIFNMVTDSNGMNVAVPMKNVIVGNDVETPF